MRVFSVSADISHMATQTLNKLNLDVVLHRVPKGRIGSIGIYTWLDLPISSDSEMLSFQICSYYVFVIL